MFPPTFPDDRLPGFTPVPPALWIALVVLAATYLAIVELFNRRGYAASGWTA